MCGCSWDPGAGQADSEKGSAGLGRQLGAEEGRALEVVMCVLCLGGSEVPAVLCCFIRFSNNMSLPTSLDLEIK